jgi:tetratricopeptide (TPR) repeat protein
MKSPSILILLAFCLCTAPCLAADLAPAARLKACIQKAEKLPDSAFADAEAWQKHGGGDRADTCWAFAQYQRGEYDEAARMFAKLATARDGRDKKQAASFHVQAAQAYMRLSDHKKAEAEYNAALRQEQQDPDIWQDRATERAAAGRFWEALDDVQKALKIMPDAPDALRLRGQIWQKLELNSNAKADFERAGLIDSAEGSKR